VTPNRGIGPPWGAFCQITLTSCFNSVESLIKGSRQANKVVPPTTPARLLSATVRGNSRDCVWVWVRVVSCFKRRWRLSVSVTWLQLSGVPVCTATVTWHVVPLGPHATPSQEIRMSSVQSTVSLYVLANLSRVGLTRFPRPPPTLQRYVVEMGRTRNVWWLLEILPYW